MAEGDTLSTHVFGVELGGYQVESVQSISGLKYSGEVVTSNQVTSDGKQLVRRQPGAWQGGELQIVRGLDHDDRFTQWIKLGQKQGDVEGARQNLTIEIKDSKGDTVRRMQLMRAWVSEWEGPSLTAGDSSPATETVTVTFEEIVIE